jgi:hypothetical protein
MIRSENSPRVCARSAGDLCAQLISLNRYGLDGLGSAAVEGVLRLVGALRNALRFATRRAVRSDALA